jgi:hypothetical protein
MRLAAVLTGLTIALGVAPPARAAEPTPLLTSNGTSDQYFSPNGDGHDDQFTYKYCLTQAAQVDAWVTDSTGLTVRQLKSAAPHDQGCAAETWDGTADDGAIVPDGLYTIHLTAQTGTGLSSENTVLAGVDTRLPGMLTDSAGQPLAIIGGLMTFVFRPTPGFTGITYVEVDVSPTSSCTSQAVCPNPGGSFAAVHSPAADGTWPATLSVGNLPAGAAKVTTLVDWKDPLGALHSWLSVPSSVTIDNSSVIVKPVGPNPGTQSGLAPLTTTLGISASDPRDRPLSYTVDFGDGSPTTQGTVTYPYPVITLTHTYTQPGEYRASITAANAAGGTATYQWSVDVTGQSLDALAVLIQKLSSIISQLLSVLSQFSQFPLFL